MTDDWRKTLISADQNIESVVFKTIRLKGAKSNRVIMIVLTCLCLLFTVSTVTLTSNYTVAANNAYKVLEEIAPLILTYGVGILGFLIAGFAILASSNHGELFEVLAKTSYPEENVSILQFIFYNFLSSIILHLALISYIFFVLIIAKLNPITVQIIDCSCVGLTVNLITLTSFILFQIFALLNVKSFVWNLYSGLLMSIATESKIRGNTAKTNQR